MAPGELLAPLNPEPQAVSISAATAVVASASRGDVRRFQAGVFSVFIV
ncbi:hypothetical protein IV498_15925 [Paenarthrobacter sp. Z7-10]|nr:hypothetical protein [Paenarthrobacter sp. Z7-10]MCZ2404625.1 hypothetical protein [Paenarthrobacter sp. Z7-10]